MRKKGLRNKKIHKKGNIKKSKEKTEKREKWILASKNPKPKLMNFVTSRPISKTR